MIFRARFGPLIRGSAPTDRRSRAWLWLYTLLAVGLVVAVLVAGGNPRAHGKEAQLLIHPWCVPHTPQWPSCVPKDYKKDKWKGWFSPAK